MDAPKPLPLRPIREHEESEEDEDSEEEDKSLLKPLSRNGSVIFNFNQIPLLSSEQTVKSTQKENRNKLNLLQGMSLVLGLQIGSGIFASPGLVLKSTGSVFASLIIWIIAGLLAWAGASSFAELGAALPVNGAQKTYLKAAYGDLPSSSFSLSSIFILKPSSLAIISIIAAEYASKVFSTSSHSPPIALVKVIAVMFIGLISAGQIISIKSITTFQVILTVFKVLSLLSLLVGGLVKLGLTGHSACKFSFENSSPLPSNYAIALFAASWCYDGFESINYVAAEVKEGKLVPVIHFSMASVIILFTMVNISYFLVVEAQQAISHPIGLAFGKELLGKMGEVFVSLIVFLSCIGALNSSVFTGSRLIVETSKDEMLPQLFSRFSSRTETPINSILLSFGMTCIFIFFGDFTRLTVFYGVVSWTYNLAVVLGLLVLRVTSPALNRPYRVYLFTPMLYASFGILLLVLSAFSKPFETIGAFALIILSTIPNLVQKYRSKRSNTHVPVMTEDYSEDT